MTAPGRRRAAAASRTPSPKLDDQIARRAAKGSAGCRPPTFDRVLYRRRNVVERCFNRLEQERDLATRYAKRASLYRASRLLVAAIVWWGVTGRDNSRLVQLVYVVEASSAYGSFRRPADRGSAHHVQARRPHALMFDLDETLLDNGGVPEAIANTCDAVAAAFDGIDARRLRLANTDAWLSYWPQVERLCWLGRMDGFAASREAWRRTLYACGCTDDEVVRYAFERHQQLSRGAYRLFADAADLLNGVASSEMRIALVTNGPSDLQRDKLRHLGIDGLFDTVVISAEIGVAKPDPAPFLVALRQLGVQPSDAWHVGDSLATDVAGARAAGLCAVWLNRHRAPIVDDSSPDIEVASLTEVAMRLTS